MENKGYSYEELTTPLVLRFRRRMERQLNKVAKVLTEALKANTVKDFAHQGTVVDRRTYVDHPTRIRAGTEIVRLSGSDPPRKGEVKHEHEGTIFHDLTERLEKAIETKKNAIRKATGKSRSTPSDKTND